MLKEIEIQGRIRLEASQRGWRLWRNNLGAGELKNGNFLRWGLANDSIATNRAMKSGDLIGIRPVLITQEMVGGVIGQFVSMEVKRPGWRFNPNDSHEKAQQRWIDLVRALGGYAIFTTNEEEL